MTAAAMHFKSIRAIFGSRPFLWTRWARLVCGVFGFGVVLLAWSPSQAQGQLSHGHGVPAMAITVQPAQARMQVGASQIFRVEVEPRRSNAPLQLRLSSSNPGVLRVPELVTVERGADSVSFTAQALQAGHAQILAELVLGVVRARGTTAVQVVPDPPRLVSLQPAQTVLQPGAQSTLTARIAAVQSAATSLTLTARSPGIVRLPETVVVPAGATEVRFDLQALAPGSSLVVASVGESAVEAAVQVQPAPVTLAALQPTHSALVVKAQGSLRISLSGAATDPTPVNLTTEPAGILDVPAQIVLLPGQTAGQVTLNALQPGTVEILAFLGTSPSSGARRATVQVTPQPAALAALEPQPLAVQRGASAQLTIRLDAAQAEPVRVELVAQRPDIVQVPAAVTIPAGQALHLVSVQALATGESLVTASLAGSQQSTTLQVTAPPPQLLPLEPSAQDLPKGRLGRLILRLDRVAQADTVIDLASTDMSIVQVPVQVTVPSGQPGTDIPLLARALGAARIQAVLAGVPQEAQIRVIEPELVALELAPLQLALSPGQRILLQATGTYSDASTRDLAADTGTTWRSTAPQVAAVDAQGGLTGVQQGTATVSAQQSIRPTWDNPQPAPVLAQTLATVGPAAPLAMAAGRTHLTEGETVSVSITTPYPAASTPYVLQLTTQGTGGLQLPASVTIGPGLSSATLAVRAVSAGDVQLRATGLPFAPAQLALVVAPAVPTRVVVTAVTPANAPVGATVTLTGEGFVTPAAANAVAYAGHVPALVLSATETRLQVRVPDAAQSGPITVTNRIGSGESPFMTVLREQDFGLQASPSQLRVVQGSHTQASLQLNSRGTDAYQGLAQLSVSGLPAGLTARFEPPQLSAYQSGRLVLLADSGAPVGAATLTVTAQATIDGLPWVRQSRVQVEVLASAGLTGVKGRLVTPEGLGIGGVIVRQDITTQQVVTDTAGNFLITGLPPGVTTLRFDATPAHALYPIWPYNVTLEAGQMLTLDDWVINPPPSDERFKSINNATQDQAITDERYPGFAVVLPAGVSITGWDGVKKTRIAVEKITPDRLPVGPPPFAMKEAYQLYFGTPMGGIPSSPIPVQLPNVAEREPGDKVEIWWFDGSPMGGTGEWKLAGLGTVSADGRTVASDPGVGLPRFCGVCGLVSLSCPPPPTPPQPPPSCPAPSAGNPVDLFTGQEMSSTSGPRCGGVTPLQAALTYNPVDAFNNRGGTLTSFGLGWTFDYDISFLPFEGSQKRLVLPGGRFVNMVDDGAGKYFPLDHPLMTGAYAQAAGNGRWDVVLPGGTRWRFEPFAGITGLLRGGAPLFITEITDPNGNAILITRHANGRIQKVSAAQGRSLRLDYGANGFVSSLQDHTGRTQTYTYTPTNRVSQIVDASGQSTTFTYQTLPVLENRYSHGKTQIACEAESVSSFEGIASIQYPHSETPTVNTYGTDRIVKQITSTGQEWKLSYRRAGACVAKLFDTPRQTASGTESFAFTCRAGQSLSSRICTNANGASHAACTEPAVGTCPEVDSDESRAAGWRFFGGVNVETRVTHPGGQQTRLKFNARGLPLEETDATGQVTRHVYNPQNRKIKTVDPLGRETRFEYDTLGHRVATIDPLGRRVETSYDTQWNKPSGSTRYLLGVPSTQGGSSLSYTPVSDSLSYDSKGNLSTILDAAGFVTRMHYDARGQLQQIVLPALAAAHQVPVVQDSVVSVLPTSARQFNFSYNAAGDLALGANALGHATRLDADALGRPTQVTDALGYTSRMQYDPLDRLTRHTDALGQDSRLDYDGAGRLAAAVNPAGVAIEGYRYDRHGRITRITDALSQATDLSFDSSGRPERITDRKGQVTRLQYNARGQLTRASRPDQEALFDYDAMGRLVELRDNASTTAWRYDAVDRVVQVDTTTAAGSHRLRYEYDSLDRVTQRTLSGPGITLPETTAYTWDLGDRLLSITTTIAGQSHQTRFEYDAAGRLAARHVQAGAQQSAITQRYGWDAADHLTQIRYLRAEGTASEQLIEQIDYRYDARGQRIARTTLNHNGTGLSDTPLQASYDAANRMTAVTLQLPEGDKRYDLTHDANGNLTRKANAQDSADTTDYRWDSQNRLVGLVQPALQASFVYDALGRRVQVSITRAGQPTATVQYLYEGLQALGEIREGRLTHRLLVGLQLDEVIARLAIAPSGQKDPAASRLYLTDALNSVIAQMGDESNAALQNSYAYSPYGQSQTIGPDTTANPIQYTGRENDGSDGTGLYYYRARYYDAVLKRFISRDPIGLAGGWNEYGYVGGDPISIFDPLGLMGRGSGANSGTPNWGKGGPCKCSTPPPGPPGICIADNIEIAKDYPAWNLGSLAGLYENVKNHGPWDYKRHGAQYEDFGNFNFGAVTAAMGVSAYTAQNSAGIYQQLRGAAAAGSGTPLLRWPYGDDPKDAAEIERGRQYAKCRCR